MNGKEAILFELLSEIHKLCTDNGILYYLVEDSKTAYALTIRMDADNMNRFISAYNGDTEHRALEWMGINYKYVGTHLKYVNTDTLYYTEDRLLSELYLGMYVRIETLKPSTSKLVICDKFRRYLHYTDKENRADALNSIAAAAHRAELKKCSGKLKGKDIAEVCADGYSFYVRRNSQLIDAIDGKTAVVPADKLCAVIRKKSNDENFICDDKISYRDIDFSAEKRQLKAVNRKFIKPRLDLKRAVTMRSECADLSRCSFYRYYYAMELLAKYSYEEMKACEAGSEIMKLLKRYLAVAVKYREKNLSVYIGDEFTDVIKTVFPKVNTEDLYKFTPELYYEGVKVCDYSGNIINIYGGRNE